LPGLVATNLPSEPAFRIPVNNEEPPVSGPAPFSRTIQLAGVERAVAATSDDHDIAEGDPIG
jgi:hypothetical protein